ncbi:MAG: hypothetical protein ACPGN3_15340 [Opitutales bacterium]
MRNNVLVFILSVFIFSVTVHGEGLVNKKSLSAEELMAELDTDESETISKDEAKANRKVKKSFKKADANSDGELDMEELRVALKKAKK